MTKEKKKKDQDAKEGLLRERRSMAPDDDELKKDII